MNYIDPVKYSELLAAFSKGTAKQVLRESVDEKKEMTPKQKKLAALAPPPDKITRADVIVGATKGKKEEGMHLGQPTAPTTTTVEGKRDFSKLQPDERKQLKEYIQSMKTIKQEIKKLMEKASVTEGGDTTNLVMPEATTDQVFSALAKTKVGMTDGSSKGYAVQIDGKQKVWRDSEEAANMAAEKLKQALPDSTIEVVPFSAISEYDDDIDIVGDEDAEYDRKQAAHDIRKSGEDELAKMMAQQDMGDEFDDMEQKDREERYRMAGPGREA